MSNLPITALFTFALGMVYLGLITQVILHRRKHRIVHGDGGDTAMKGKMRAQLNAHEQLPLFLIALGVAEIQGAWAWWLTLIGLTFLAGRVAHAYGMTCSVHPMRVIGTSANLSGLILVLLTLFITLF